VEVRRRFETVLSFLIENKAFFGAVTTCRTGMNHEVLISRLPIICR
jgi:hypothetical protein